MNNKALSQVVTIVIFISLALISISIVWAVFSNVVQEGVEDIDVNSRCVTIDFVIDAAECEKGVGCSVIITRGSGGDVVDGFAIKVVDSTGTISSDVLEVDSEIVALGTGTVTVSSTTIPDTTGGKVVVNAYLTDAQNNNVFCSQSVEYDNPTSTVVIVLPGDGEACTVTEGCQTGFECEGSLCVSIGTPS